MLLEYQIAKKSCAECRRQLLGLMPCFYAPIRVLGPAWGCDSFGATTLRSQQRVLGTAKASQAAGLETFLPLG